MNWFLNNRRLTLERILILEDIAAQYYCCSMAACVFPIFDIEYFASFVRRLSDNFWQCACSDLPTVVKLGRKVGCKSRVIRVIYFCQTCAKIKWNKSANWNIGPEYWLKYPESGIFRSLVERRQINKYVFLKSSL